METMEAIARRKSTRDFDPNKPVPEEVVARVLEAGCQAPIGGYSDSLHLTVCTDRSLIAWINHEIGLTSDFTYGAPVVIFVSASPRQFIPGIETYNTSCVIENMLIAATDAGLGNIFLSGGVMMAADNKEISSRLGIPEGYRLVSAAAIGYSKSGEARPRKLSVSLGTNYV